MGFACALQEGKGGVCLLAMPSGRAGELGVLCIVAMLYLCIGANAVVVGHGDCCCRCWCVSCGQVVSFCTAGVKG
jgi:hypothetical protein